VLFQEWRQQEQEKDFKKNRHFRGTAYKNLFGPVSEDRQQVSQVDIVYNSHHDQQITRGYKRYRKGMKPGQGFHAQVGSRGQACGEKQLNKA
jgi:hypothetical protein